MKNYEKKTMLLWAWLFVFIAQKSHAQAVTATDYFPNGDREITIIFDVKQAKDGRAAGLLGKTSDVFLWSGAGTSENGNAFEYQPTGQTNFNAPFEAGRMTSLGNDRWSIKIKPRDYYKVPASQPIKRLGLLLKSGDGKAQTEDFFLRLYDNSQLYISIRKPLEKTIILEKDTIINVTAVVSSRTEINIYTKGSTTKSWASGVGDSLKAQIRTAELESNVEVIAEGNATPKVTDSFRLIKRPVNNVAALPANIKDGINYIDDNTVILSFFAPQKKFVYVVGEFNAWQLDNRFLMNQTPDGQRFWLRIGNLVKGQEYAYQYLVDGEIAVADPFTEKILDPNFDRSIPASNYPNLKAYPNFNPYGGIVSVLQTAQPQYNWKVKEFKRPAKEKLVIYELLVRDFVQSRRYRDVADSLGYLKKLGINALELMPVKEFTANDSWGYNPIFYTAPDKAYGTKDDLKYLIDKCHENGIAVIMDVVFNQADRESPYVKMYWDGSQPSKDSPFFNQKATHPFSVFYDFNHESKATQEFMDKVCEFWVKEYKIDGYRFDLSKGFTQVQSDPNVAFWGNYDASRVKIWKRIYDKIRSYDKDAYLILEHFADNPEETELANYGFLLWGNMNGNFRNTAKGFLNSLDWLSYQRRGWREPNLIGYMESHDEERMMVDILANGKTGEQNTKDLSQALERVKSSAALFFAYPGPKMIWQFGELGYDVSIDFNGRTGVKPIRWEYLNNDNRLKLYKTFAELIKLKTTQEAFNSTNFSESSGEMVKKINITHPTMDVHIIANMDVVTREANLNFTKTGKWYDYFTGKEIEVTDLQKVISLRPSQFHIFTTTKLPTPEAGIVPWSTDSFTITSTEPNAQAFDYQAYPNPVSDKLTLKLGNGKSEIVVEDLWGGRHYSVITEKEEILLDFDYFPAGTYLVKTIKDGKVKVKKVVKQ